MISILAYSQEKEELEIIKDSTIDATMMSTKEEWTTNCFQTLKELEKFLEDQPQLEMGCFDVTKNGSLDRLSNIRKEYRNMLLMLIADTSMSPMDYVRPDILASSLILRPFERKDLKEKWIDMIHKYMDENHLGQQEEVFSFDTREGKVQIPYHQIYYLESRDKKIYIRLLKKEIPFYGTLEELEELLPENFARCHRSYMVNVDNIEEVHISQSEIIMNNDIFVPLSRSYKSQFKSIKKMA